MNALLIGAFFILMNFKKIKVTETRNAIINVDLLVGIFYEPISCEYNAGNHTVLRFTNGYYIEVKDKFVKDILIVLGLENV